MIFFLLYQSMLFGIALSRYIYVDPLIAPSIPNYARNNNFTPFRNEPGADISQMLPSENVFQSRPQTSERVFYNNQQANKFANYFEPVNPSFASKPIEEYNPESLEKQTNDLLNFIKQRTKSFDNNNDVNKGNNQLASNINSRRTSVINNYYTQDHSVSQARQQNQQRSKHDQINYNPSALDDRPQRFDPSQNQIDYSTANHNVNNYQTPIIKKHFYFHVAPPEPAAIPNPATVIPRKNYKIIFIKAPSQEPDYATRLRLLQAAQQVEEKTLVYVLSKNPEPQLPFTNYEPSKPEVYFINYKNKNSSASDTMASLIDQSIVNGKGNPEDAILTEGHGDSQENRTPAYELSN